MLTSWGSVTDKNTVSSWFCQEIDRMLISLKSLGQVGHHLQRFGLQSPAVLFTIRNCVHTQDRCHAILELHRYFIHWKTWTTRHDWLQHRRRQTFDKPASWGWEWLTTRSLYLLQSNSYHERFEASPVSDRRQWVSTSTFINNISLMAGAAAIVDEFPGKRWFKRRAVVRSKEHGTERLYPRLTISNICIRIYTIANNDRIVHVASLCLRHWQRTGMIPTSHMCRSTYCARLVRIKHRHCVGLSAKLTAKLRNITRYRMLVLL